MAEIAQGMVRDVLNAYGARDALLAIEVINRDEKLDKFYNSLFRNLVTHMMENPATISSAAQLLFVARNLERIGDHATNVAEMVYFAATGQYCSERDDPRTPTGGISDEAFDPGRRGRRRAVRAADLEPRGRGL